MEKYNRRASLLCELYDEKARKVEYQRDAYRDVLLEIEGISSPADLWAYLDAEKKKTILIEEEHPSYDEWEKARSRLVALENAEKWLRRVEEVDESR